MKQLRYLSSPIEAALKKKMVIIGGPRQVGKTTLSLQFLNPPSPKNPAYLNWDRATAKADLELLLKFGGFPEPLFAENENEHRIWQNERMNRVVYEDLRDLENIK